MKQPKSGSIFLFKQPVIKVENRTINTSRSRSALRDNPGYQRTIQQRLKSSNFMHNASMTSKLMDLGGNEQHSKRGYSPLYQRSNAQSELFEKGVRKSSRNINLESRVDLSWKPVSPLSKSNAKEDLSPKTIRRRDPNKQQQNLLQLGSKPLVTSRSVNLKRNPNVQSSFKESRREKSQVKDPNVQTSDTADYVVRALATHTGNQVKEVHLKFTKKENIVNKQNLNNQINQKPGLQNHKRHYSHMPSHRDNIEFKEGVVCIKQDYQQKSKHRRKQFNNDFYRKESRMPNNKQNQTQNKSKFNTDRFTTGKTIRLETGVSRNLTKMDYQSGNQKVNRMAQLRKRFL